MFRWSKCSLSNVSWVEEPQCLNLQNKQTTTVFQKGEHLSLNTVYLQCTPAACRVTSGSLLCTVSPTLRSQSESMLYSNTNNWSRQVTNTGHMETTWFTTWLTPSDSQAADHCVGVKPPLLLPLPSCSLTLCLQLESIMTCNTTCRFLTRPFIKLKHSCQMKADY